MKCEIFSWNKPCKKYLLLGVGALRAGVDHTQRPCASRVVILLDESLFFCPPFYNFVTQIEFP